MKRRRTKIGDIYSAKIDEKTKRYFQYVANDLTQLNSDVIRVFINKYPIADKPDLESIINTDIDIYAHCSVKLGLKLGHWEYVGNVPFRGSVDVLFRDTNDYGRAPDEEPILISDRWYVWMINEEFTNIGKLEGEYLNSFVGLVINPNGILELLRGNKYPPKYPD